MRRRWLVFVLLALVTTGAAGVWWRSGGTDASGAAPRLVVDRTEVDLGYRRFDTLARASFTLANAGHGPLRLTELPPVEVRAGC